MLRRARRREIGFGLVLALLAAPVGSAAAAPEWDAGEVEAAHRYRALERERALRFRAAAEERVAEPRRAERASQRALRPVRPGDDRAPPMARRIDPQVREEPLFEPWVSRLAQALGAAVLHAFVQAGHDVWLALRDEIETWLEDAWPERPAWTDADWRRRE